MAEAFCTSAVEQLLAADCGVGCFWLIGKRHPLHADEHEQPEADYYRTLKRQVQHGRERHLRVKIDGLEDVKPQDQKKYADGRNKKRKQ